MVSVILTHPLLRVIHLVPQSHYSEGPYCDITISRPSFNRFPASPVETHLCGELGLTRGDCQFVCEPNGYFARPLRRLRLALSGFSVLHFGVSMIIGRF